MHIRALEDKNIWGEVIEQCEQYDFYHTFDYHQISKRDGEKPILLEFRDGDNLIALPLLIRDIDGTPYKDATSVYGYAGPLTRNITRNFNNASFKKMLKEFLMDSQIVSVFSRLHPFIKNQEPVLSGIGEIIPHGHIVNIDLTKNLNEQKRGYNRRLRTYINKEAHEYKIIDGTCEECLDAFIGVYCENMKRVKANPSYFFGKKYFYELLASGQIHARLLVAQHIKTSQLAGGAIFTMNNGIVQYHLSGVKEEFLNLNPIKLLIDHVRVQSTNEGYSYFNLGGGLGGQDNDSLFYFKSGFSKDFKTFQSWQYVVDKRKYQQIIKQKETLDGQNTNNSCFFPIYRQTPPNEMEISEINCLGND
ncbi:GNAT family N-acetyltransferase [Flagellimonas pelagia]|uniref:GNAT family N-acetyltransferase n=1 Tax=Flagellimonas pelagia TaxID=2306998 RepID=A0A3A1NCN0_9FLAO|nr:GNAT family N-acetyltransferase [Allomuricauda maritima]RIV42155.1 GNAT family N-acetyltransferase [Allomuricauda maritima]TXJ91043.1 GNAT family N-acetyltransferase [Allomuricauda maritima]